MEIVDVDRNKRAFIDSEGKLIDLQGNIIGFINSDGSSGDASENFMGEINDDGQISNGDNTLIGSVDLGTAEMRDHNGSHFGTIKPGGDIFNAIDGFRGRVSPFTFHKLKMIAAYIFFFDQNIVDPALPTKLPIPGAPLPQALSSERLLTPKTPLKKSSVESAISPPSPAPVVESPVKSPVPMIIDREYKDYQVGNFKTISEGKENLLEISNCDCPVEQLVVKIEEKGKQVIFERTIIIQKQKKLQVQRFSMPYMVNKNRVTAQYALHKDFGTLRLLFRKPEGASSGGISGQFVKFIVPAVPDSENKVTIKPSQVSDHFIFEPNGDPKLETEVIGELEEGTIKFHAITKDLQMGVSKKATQTFSLNVPISMSQIDIENGGRKVLVYPSRPIPLSSTEPTPEDSEIPIQSI